MKKSISFFCLIAAALLSAHAQNTQKFSTADADVFISRRVDIWSPNTVEMKYPRQAVENKNFNFYHFDDNGKFYAVFTSRDGTLSKSPLSKTIQDDLVQYKATLMFSGNSEYFNRSNYIRDEQIKLFLKAQRAFYTDMIIKAGDPAKLTDQVSRQSFFGNALSLFSTLTVGKIFGADVASGFGSVFMDDLANLPTNVGALALPIPLNDVDIDLLPEYKLLEVKRIGPTPKGWANGQILIAYKNERTPEMAQELFIRAIPVALGADTTVEAIDVARNADYEARKVIWAKCVADKDARCN